MVRWFPHATTTRFWEEEGVEGKINGGTFVKALYWLVERVWWESTAAKGDEEVEKMLIVIIDCKNVAIDTGAFCLDSDWYNERLWKNFYRFYGRCFDSLLRTVGMIFLLTVCDERNERALDFSTSHTLSQSKMAWINTAKLRDRACFSSSFSSLLFFREIDTNL